MPEKTHGERWLVVNGRTLTYSGIFHLKELFSTINISLQKKGYTLKEKRNEEVVTENGRNIFFELRPYKEMTKQVTLLIKLKINLKNVTQQVQELRGNIFSFDKGDIEIVFDSWSYTDFEDRWAAKALPFTISTVIDKIFLIIIRFDIFFLKLIQHPLIELLKVFFCKVTTSNPRLIGNYNDFIAKIY